MTPQIKKEAGIIGIIYVTLVLAVTLFLNDGFGNAIRIISTYYWLYLIPGYFLTFAWVKKIDVFTRIIMGFGCSIGLNVFLSYYLNLFGIKNSTHPYFLPIVIIMVGLGIYFWSGKEKTNAEKYDKKEKDESQINLS